jgi:hypothetical protein
MEACEVVRLFVKAIVSAEPKQRGNPGYASASKPCSARASEFATDGLSWHSLAVVFCLFCGVYGCFFLFVLEGVRYGVG